MNHPTSTRRRLQPTATSGAHGLRAEGQGKADPNGSDPNRATFAPTGDPTLTAARSLASQIERLNLPEVVTANPVKAEPPDGAGPEPWMVSVVYTSASVPVQVTSIPNARRVGWDEKKTSNPEQARAWIQLGIVSGLVWAGVATVGAAALWWTFSPRDEDPSSNEGSPPSQS